MKTQPYIDEIDQKQTRDNTFENPIVARLLLWGMVVLGAALFTAIYWDTILWLYSRYTLNESYYSHGFLVPFIVGYFIYRKKDELAAIPVSYSWFGLVFVGVALLVHTASLLVHVFFVSGFSILLLAVGICLFVFGMERTRVLLVPLLYLMFMLPLPLLLIQQISLPLKSIVTSLSISFTNLLGIPAVQTGLVINLPDGVLVIGNPCSGLRSMISFLALGSVFAITARISKFKKALFLMLCIPIAILSNVTRVVFLVIVGNLAGIEYVAEGTFYHDSSGYAVFLLGVALMGLFWKILDD